MFKIFIKYVIIIKKKVDNMVITNKEIKKNKINESIMKVGSFINAI